MFLLNGIFFGGGACLDHSRAKAKTRKSFRGGVYSNLNVLGACLMHILAKSSNRPPAFYYFSSKRKMTGLAFLHIEIV